MIVDHQRRFMQVLLDAEPPAEALEKLGGLPERWLTYRHMVRRRMQGMIKSGLPRTVTALGDARYQATYDAWLDEAPPRTRFIREIVPAFADFAIPRWNADKDVPRWVIELGRLEAAKWEVGYIDVPWPEEPGEFTFEKMAVMNPTLRQLRFDHPVQKELEAGQTKYTPKATAVMIYRKSEDDRLYTWVPNALSADLVDGWLAGAETVADVVKRVCAKHDTAITEKFIESLGGMLADFIEQGIVLGGK